MGSPDRRSEADLHRLVREVMEEEAQADLKQAVQSFEQRVGRNGQTTTAIEEVVSAAVTGLVEELFIRADAESTGVVDESGEVHVTHAAGMESDDLLDVAAVHTLRNGGKVHVAPEEFMPPVASGAPVVGLLRA